MPESALYRRVFENNRAWVARMKGRDPAFFERLSGSQNPDFLYIGCSDSRVPPNVIVGLDPGSLFVHCNIANLVPHTDLNVQSVIQYAVEVLNVKHIVVCGHYGCGGVKAAMQPVDQGLLNPWLREVRDVYRHHFDLLDRLDGEERYQRLVELNVRQQCIHVMKTASVQKSWLKHHTPTVHGWVYDVHSGLLEDLRLDFEHEIETIRRVYHLEP